MGNVYASSSGPSPSFLNPSNKIVHSVTKVTTINVRPREEYVNRLTNAIRNPNPPMSIMFTSSITVVNYYKMCRLKTNIT